MRAAGGRDAGIELTWIGGSGHNQAASAAGSGGAGLGRLGSRLGGRGLTRGCRLSRLLGSSSGWLLSRCCRGRRSTSRDKTPHDSQNAQWTFHSAHHFRLRYWLPMLVSNRRSQ
jgi:hypothetical protein